MTILDQLFFSVFNYYKGKKNKFANRVASWYITILESALILLLGIFFAEFFKNMRMDTMSETAAWTLFGIAVVVLYFKNWIKYSGRKRRVLNAKYSGSKSFNRNIVSLWLFPVCAIILAIILLQVTK
ncbi:MAG: hypothetical protein KJO77_10815 [Bacteroidia bacterium]|nr:hypothetical protein [Bacteroidia bacterium]